jgi:hypothetical protein
MLSLQHEHPLKKAALMVPEHKLTTISFSQLLPGRINPEALSGLPSL